MKKITIAFIVVVLAIGAYFFFTFDSEKPDLTVNQNPPTDGTGVPVGGDQGQTPVNKALTVIGKSVGGRDIVAYHFGEGSEELLFIGGIHGGYEWNTALVAGELMKYLKANPSVVPANLKVTVIPVLNPDGLYKAVGTSTPNFSQADVSSSEDVVVAGRFNGNNIDLNRNFDCDWQANGKWQNKIVSGGTGAFSEPESLAIKNYVEAGKPVAVVTWYSAAGGVFASSCHNGVSTETNKLTELFSKASGYPAYQDFDFYEITGDMVNWFARENIPAISVLLTNHTDIEWTKNKAGFEALLNYYAK